MIQAGISSYIHSETCNARALVWLDVCKRDAACDPISLDLPSSSP